LITVLCLLACGVVIVVKQDYISEMLIGFEVVSTVIFFIFIFIDASLMNGANSATKELTHSTDEELRKKFRRTYFFSRDSILFIDLPVFIASAVILFLSIGVVGNGISGDENNIFHNGFSTGALVVHIVFSQFIFMMLKIRDSFMAFTQVIV
jgi:hypothetical protein